MHRLELDILVYYKTVFLEQKHRKQQHAKEKSNLHAEEGTKELTSVKCAVPGDASL